MRRLRCKSICSFLNSCQKASPIADKVACYAVEQTTRWRDVANPRPANNNPRGARLLNEAQASLQGVEIRRQRDVAQDRAINRETLLLSSWALYSSFQGRRKGALGCIRRRSLGGRCYLTRENKQWAIRIGQSEPPVSFSVSHVRMFFSFFFFVF